MGEIISCCNADIFSDLTHKYGQSFTKLMIAEKSKEFILAHFQQLIIKFKDVFLQFQNKVTGVVSTKKGQLSDIYNKLKAEVNGKIPGGIDIFQKIKGQSINEFSGYNRLHSQVDNIKTQTLGKIDSEKDMLLSSVDIAKSKMINKIDQQKPKIEYYDSLPPEIQKVLRVQAQKLLAKQIDQNKTQIANQVAKQFTLENAMKMLTKFSPDQQLTGIVGKAGELLSSALGQINPGSGSGGIGSLIQGGLSFFGT